MIHSDFMKDMVGLLKNNVDNTFKTMGLLQEQSEKIANMMVEQGLVLQNEGMKIVQQWVKSVKEQQDHYQQNVKSQLEKLEQLVGKSEKNKA